MKFIPKFLIPRFASAAATEAVSGRRVNMMRLLPCDSRMAAISADVKVDERGGEGEVSEGSLTGTMGVGEMGRTVVPEEVLLALAAVIVSVVALRLTGSVFSFLNHTTWSPNRLTELCECCHSHQTPIRRAHGMHSRRRRSHRRPSSKRIGSTDISD
jgi:hypothetical protein